MSRDTVLTNQKVLSFSFWGQMSSGYFNGIVGNLELMRTLYPDYVMRLYVSKAKGRLQRKKTAKLWTLSKPT